MLRLASELSARFTGAVLNRCLPLLLALTSFACQSGTGSSSTLLASAAVNPARPIAAGASGSSAAASSASATAAANASASASAMAAASASASASAVPTSSASAEAGPCPPEMALVDRTCVDRWEGTLAKDDGSAHSPYERPEKGVRYLAKSERGVFPQAYISGDEAQAACNAVGKRLCSVREWYRACRGRRGTIFPYGEAEKRGACNNGKAHLLSRYFGRDARRWSYEDHFNSPKLNRTEGFLAKTGAYEGCVSDFGVADLVGNLHEWVSDKVDSQLPQKVPLRKDILKKLKKNTGHGVFMGGFYSTDSQHGRGCTFTTIGHESRYHDYSTGFRCCRDASGLAEPPAKTKRAAPAPH